MSNTTQIVQNPERETAWQKTVRKASEEPMVPLGGQSWADTAIDTSTSKSWIDGKEDVRQTELICPLAGMALTTVALIGATQSMQKGNRAQFNRMLRFRVLAQGFTVVGELLFKRNTLSSQSDHFPTQLLSVAASITARKGGRLRRKRHCKGKRTNEIESLTCQ